MEIKPVYEFLLWDNCNNNCSFCFQREKCINLTINQKRESLNKMRQFLESEKYVNGSHILLVGGEIFDDVSPEMKDIWWDIINYLGKKMNKKDIDLLYVNTNLLFKDLTLLDYLFQTIQYYGLFGRLKFTTSYDLKGRFATKRREKLFLDNLKKIKEKYPDCNIVVNTILTKKTCEMILNGSFNPKDFCDEYKCDINLIPYIIYIEELSAPRNQIFETLLYVDKLIPNYLENYIRNFDLPQEKLLYKYTNGDFVFSSCGHSECGHSENFKKYDKEETCFVCDIKGIYNV